MLILTFSFINKKEPLNRYNLSLDKYKSLSIIGKLK